MASRAGNQRYRAYTTIFWAMLAVVIATTLDASQLFHRRFKGPLAELEPLVSDFFIYNLWPPNPPTGDVVIAEVDDRSIVQLGRFPWPRTIEAALVDALTKDGAKVVTFDMFFSERDPADVEREQVTARLRKAGISDKLIGETLGPSGDEAFQRALTNNGSTILAYAFSGHMVGAEQATDKNATQSVFLQPPPVAYNLVRKHPGAATTLISADSYIPPIPMLNQAARGVAYADIDAEEDGRVRAYPAVTRFNGRFCVPLFLASSRAYLDRANLILSLGPGLIKGAILAGRQIPLDEMGKMMVRFRGPAGTFPHYSIADIINGVVGPSELRNKIVITGVTAHALGDRFVTPLGADFPGVEIQATAIDNVLRADFLHQSVDERGEERWAGWVFGVVIGLATAFLTAVQSLALLVFLIAAYVSYVLHRFRANGAVIGMVFPVFTLLLTYLTTISYRYMVEGRDRRRLRSAFEMYLHPDVLASVVDDPEGLKLGGQRHHLSVLFSDIVGFTELAERLEPEPLVALLNTYMSVMTDVILNTGGVVDKLMGDGIMAFWGPPLGMKNAARAAIDCALKMLTELQALGERDERFNSLRIGVGIATGDAIVGNLGGERHFDYSAVGDTINLASRLEGLTRIFKVKLLMNRDTLEEAGSGYISREVGLVRVKGRGQLEPVVEVVGLANDGIDSSYYDRFAEAIAAIHNGGSPEKSLEELLSERPNDTVTAMCLERLRATVGQSEREIIFEFDRK